MVLSPIKYFFLLAFLISCGSRPKSKPFSSKELGLEPVGWKERLQHSPCVRPKIATRGWPLFVTRHQEVTLRIPPSLHQDPYDPARKQPGADTTKPTPASSWTHNKGIGNVQFTIVAVDTASLEWLTPLEAEESICVETVDGASATIMSYKWTIRPGDDVYLGPYMAVAVLRFPDGLSLRVFAQAADREQRDQILAAIRSITRTKQ
jgi:hypothetical protein